MKKQLLVVLLTVATLPMFAQDNKVMKDYYSFHGGLLGALNLTTLRAEDGTGVPRDIRTYDHGVEPGWSVGGWVNFPIGKAFAIEPQYMFSSYSYDNGDVNFGTGLLGQGTPFVRGSVQYHSIPLLFKIYLGDAVAIAAGPQLDLASNVSDKNATYVEGQINKATFAVNAGLEIFPRDRFTVFGRYIKGLSELNNARELGNTWSFQHDNIQVGLKVRLFGGLVKADRDGDGIPDESDKCPDVFGLERYMGCPIPDSDGDGFNDEVDECPQVAGVANYNGCPVPDTDGDGVNDELDKCPDVKGSPKYNGCPVPDTDGDGINDDDDKCRTVKGLAKYNGCPIPDTDGDGVNDEEDRCPTVVGLAKYNGCPIPDTDGDGVNDEEDRCPTVPGVVAMRGCPEIKSFESYEVTFNTGSATLTSTGRKELDLVVAYLKENPNLKIRLDGHTDNTGSAGINDKLSIDRANSSMNYLVSKGIAKDRMEAFGFGASQPAADNGTAAGRAKNRRVEILPK